MIEFLDNNTVKDLDPGETYGNIRRRLISTGLMAHFMLLRAISGNFTITDSPYGIVLSDNTLPGNSLAKGPLDCS